MKRLLVSYDGSHAADEAISDLIHAALPSDLEVTVMSVADVYLPPSPPGPEPDRPPQMVQRMREKAAQEVAAQHGLAQRACARLQTLFPQWRCSPLAVGDSPGWALVQKATEWKADLVLVGSHSHSRLQRLFLGSVAHKVAAEAPCSVRIGRLGPATAAPCVIVAVDGSAESRTTLLEVARRRWPAGTEFRLVTVVDSRLETAVAWPGFAAECFVQTQDENGREWISRMVEDSAKILFEAGLNVTNYTYDGDPKDVLLRVAGEWQAQTIFMGARGLNHGPHLTLGTVASAVATRAACSVEIVRERPV